MRLPAVKPSGCLLQLQPTPLDFQMELGRAGKRPASHKDSILFPDPASRKRPCMEGRVETRQLMSSPRGGRATVG